MPHRPIVILVGLLLAVGLPLYFVVIKKRAASSLEDLLTERFKARACPVAVVEVPEGGRVHCQQAYDDSEGSGLVLVVGSWERGQVKTQTGATYVEQRVAGLYKPGGDAGWAERAKGKEGVIVAAAVEGGAIAIWQGLPSSDSVIAHLEAVR